MTTVIALGCSAAHAATVTFFDPLQAAKLVAEGTTSDTIRSNGYLFTYTRDKLFTGGLGGDPIGRYVRIPWPEGVEAQAVTAGPNPGKAKITIERGDGDVFAFAAFSAELLANTAGAGAKFEVVPFLNGEEVWQDPLQFEASGFTGRTFSYDTTPNPNGSTALLVGFDKYSIDLYVDFALIGLTFEGAPIPIPPGDYNQDFVVDAADYTVWRNTLNTNVATGTGADGSGPLDVPDGFVDRYDYDFWKAHYGDAAGSGSVTTRGTPEPTSLMLFAVALVFAAVTYSKRLSRPS
jgi:hypothetical protein